MQRTAILMGSDSDLAVAEAAARVLYAAGAPYEMRVMSAHRTPDSVREFALTARENGFGVIIAIAGMAAQLAGAVAANTTLPVIGVPVSAGALNGLDALLSTVQMPSGVPVASVAIDGGANGAWLALRMLALGDAELTRYLEKARGDMAAAVAAKDAALNESMKAAK